MLVIACATLVLCSCRARHAASPPSPAPPQVQPVPTGQPLAMNAAADSPQREHLLVAHQEPVNDVVPGPVFNGPMPPTAPQQGIPPHGMTAPPHGMPPGPYMIPYPEGVTTGPWRPPGIACPWPRDEYLFDGGDHQSPAFISPDFTVHGLEMEDTIAHYDQLDGRTCISPSNKVCLYAPRFMAVRSVTGLVLEQQIEQPFGAERPTVIAQSAETKGPVSRLQNLQPGAQVAVKGPDQFLGRDVPLAVSTRRPTVEFAQGFLPYENFRLLRLGQIDDAERPFLAVNVKNAIAWVHNQGVQVLLKDQRPSDVIGEDKVQGVHTFDPPCPGKIRICKVASTNGALPGEIVDFTLRYDNVGESMVGNVTIIDNLTTRLEYVPDTAQSSRPADFFTTENSGGSLILRWEIIDPVPAGEGGVIRFRCRVR